MSGIRRHKDYFLGCCLSGQKLIACDAYERGIVVTQAADVRWIAWKRIEPVGVKCVIPFQVAYQRSLKLLLTKMEDGHHAVARHLAFVCEKLRKALAGRRRDENNGLV